MLNFTLVYLPSNINIDNIDKTNCLEFYLS